MTNETNEIKKDDLSESTVLTIDNTTTSSVDKLKEIIDFKIEKDQMYNTDKIYGNDISIQKPFRLGKTYAFFYRNGDPLFVIGPHWPFYIGLSGTISVIGYFFFFYLWMILNTIIAYMGVFIFGFFFLSYTVTVLINPGVPSRKYSIINLNQAKIKNKKICTICQIYMDEEKMVSHCYECMVCIEGI